MLAALLAAAAPPPMTATDPAEPNRSCAVPQPGIDIPHGLQHGSSPEAVGHTGGDDQRVVGFHPLVAVGLTDTDRAGREVGAGERAVHGADAIEFAEPVEADPVIACPVIGPGQPRCRAPDR